MVDKVPALKATGVISAIVICVLLLMAYPYYVIICIFLGTAGALLTFAWGVAYEEFKKHDRARLG